MKHCQECLSVISIFRPFDKVKKMSAALHCKLKEMMPKK